MSARLKNASTHFLLLMLTATLGTVSWVLLVLSVILLGLGHWFGLNLGALWVVVPCAAWVVGAWLEAFGVHFPPPLKKTSDHGE